MRRLRYALPVGLVVLGVFVLISGIMQQVMFHQFRSYWDLELALPKGATAKDVEADIRRADKDDPGWFPIVTVHEKRDDGPNVRLVCGPGGCRRVPLRFTAGNVWASISPNPEEGTKATVRSALAQQGTTIVAETVGTIALSFWDWAWALLMLVIIPGILFASAWDLIRYYRRFPRAAVSPGPGPM